MGGVGKRKSQRKLGISRMCDWPAVISILLRPYWRFRNLLVEAVFAFLLREWLQRKTNRVHHISSHDLSPGRCNRLTHSGDRVFSLLPAANKTTAYS